MFDVYYIDYYDMNDGWLGWEYIEKYRRDRIFTNFTAARNATEALNEGLAFGNVSYGEHYEVHIERNIDEQNPCLFSEYCKEADGSYVNL